MPEPEDHTQAFRTAAIDTIRPVIDHMANQDARFNIVDIQGVQNLINAGTAWAMLYVGDQIRAHVEVQSWSVEQQKLANVLAAIGRSDGAGGDMLGRDLEEAAVEYIRARIGDIVNPTPESESSGFDRDSELEEFDGFKQMSGGGGE
jgi:hypothetical protein